VSHVGASQPLSVRSCPCGLNAASIRRRAAMVPVVGTDRTSSFQSCAQRIALPTRRCPAPDLGTEPL
jgi:hypothetical protein